MDYLEALRRNGWLPDPSDQVRVVAEHATGCSGRAGHRCDCVPRLVLQPLEAPRREPQPAIPVIPIRRAG
jgi:hypothetical protein